MYRTDFWTLSEKVRVGCFKRTASKDVYYLVWNRSPAQVGCMRQVLRPGALGRPRGMGWGGRWEGGSRWGIHANPWLILVNIWQKPLQYCKVISLQLIKKINGKKKEKQEGDLVALRKHEVSLEEVSTSWEGNNKENQRETYRVWIIAVNKVIWIQESLNENTDQLALYSSQSQIIYFHIYFHFSSGRLGFAKKRKRK